MKHNGNKCRFVVVLLVMQIGPDWKCVGNCDSALVNTARTSGNCTVLDEGAEAPHDAAESSGPYFH